MAFEQRLQTARKSTKHVKNLARTRSFGLDAKSVVKSCKSPSMHSDTSSIIMIPAITKARGMQSFLNKSNFDGACCSLEIVPVDDAHAHNFVGGLVNQVADGLADLAIAPIFITADRLSVVSFTHSYADTGYVLVTKGPQPSLVST
eukprot:scaffold9160_cov15-Prasinocladus_malaysianus.AAC.1